MPNRFSAWKIRFIISGCVVKICRCANIFACIKKILYKRVRFASMKLFSVSRSLRRRHSHFPCMCGWYWSYSSESEVMLSANLVEFQNSSQSAFVRWLADPITASKHSVGGRYTVPLQRLHAHNNYSALHIKMWHKHISQASPTILKKKNTVWPYY